VVSLVIQASSPVYAVTARERVSRWQQRLVPRGGIPVTGCRTKCVRPCLLARPASMTFTSEGVMALFAHGVINRSLGWPWASS
jgi:hypothetical protein